MTINWEITPDEADLIDQIVYRAEDLALEHDLPVLDTLSLEMDIRACHANGCRLKLKALLDADGFNFAHDVFGIRNHMNRKTGRLAEHFLPRFAERH